MPPNFLRQLAAVLFGNAVYLLVQSHLPRILRHRVSSIDLGLLFDFAVCVAAYFLLGWLTERRRGANRQSRP